MLKYLFLFFNLQILFVQGGLAQEDEENHRTYKLKWRSQVNINYFSFGESFFTGPHAVAPGVKVGPILDWKKTEHRHFRIEPNLEYERLRNRFNSRGNEAVARFQTFYLGSDFIPLLYDLGKEKRINVGLGLFAKYAISHQSTAEINGNPFGYEKFEIRKFQSGWILTSGIRLNQTWIEIRFYQSFGELVRNDRTPNNVNQLALNVLW